MKFLLVMLLSLSAFSASRVYDPANILPDVDNFLAAKPFYQAFNFNQATTASQRNCQYQYRGVDTKWFVVGCSFEETVNYWIARMDVDNITVSYRSNSGNYSYNISRNDYEFWRGNHVRRIIDRTQADEVEVLSQNVGISTAGGKSINTRTVTLRNWIFNGGRRIAFYQRVTVSRDVPYISQIVDYSAYDLDVSLNRLLDFRL